MLDEDAGSIPIFALEQSVEYFGASISLCRNLTSRGYVLVLQNLFDNVNMIYE